MVTQTAIDLEPEYREVIVALLQEHVPDCEVRAYGSRVQSTARATSDLDIAVIFDDNADTRALYERALYELREALEEPYLPFSVDVLNWNTLPERFRPEISHRYVILQRAMQDLAWQKVALGECVHINESQYSKDDRWSFINYLDTGSITEGRVDDLQYFVPGVDKIPSRARRKCRPGDIVYSTVRPNQRHYGLLDNLPDNFLVSTGFAVIRADNEIAQTDFLYWFLTQNHVVDHLQTLAEQNASAYPSIRPDDLARLDVLLPTIEEQRRIAAVLGVLDDKIELNRQRCETLEKMARALFKAWFVDFEPVRAKVAGIWREGESLSGLPANLYSLFPDQIVDSEVGPIPATWFVHPLGDIMELAYGKALKSSNRRNGSVPVFGSNGRIGWHDEAHVKGPGIIVGRKGNPGLVNRSMTDFCPIDTTFYAMPTRRDISIEFLLYALEKQDLPSIAADTAVPGLNRNLVYMNLLLIPPKPVMSEFARQVSIIWTRVSCIEEMSLNLVTLRDVLLPKLMSGEVR